MSTLLRGRESEPTRWPIGVFVIALHVALLVALLRIHWTLPAQPLVSAMTLVELRLLSKPDSTAGVAKKSHAAISVPGHSAAAAPSLARHKPVARKIERSALSDAAENPAGAADATSPASNPVSASGNAGGRSDGVGATGGSGALHAKFRPPFVVRRYKPSYPEDALLARHEGSVDVIVTIAADSSVHDAHVYRSSGDASLDRASVEAAARYIFRPARRGDDATEAQAIVTIDWNIVETVSHWSRTYDGLRAAAH